MLYASEAFRQAVVDTSRTWALKMDVTLSSGEVLHLTEANVNLGSTVFKEGATCKDVIQVGSTFSNSLDFALMNGSGEFSQYDFSRAKVHAYIGLVLPNGSTEWVSTGNFTVVDCGKKLSTIPIYSMDDMYKANVPLSKVGIVYPIDINLFVQNIAAYCEIPVHSSLTEELRNLQYTLQAPEDLDDKTTCRDVFGYIGVILGKNLRISREGFLESFWYSSQGQQTTPSTRVKNSEFKDGAVNVTGVIITDNAGDTYDIGTDDYVVTYDVNPFIQSAEVAQETLQRVYSNLHSMTYYAGKIYFMGDPTWQAGDVVTHVLKDNTRVVSPIMSSTYSFRGTQTLQAVGETPEQEVQLSATAKKMASLDMKQARDLKEGMTTMQHLILQQSELITNALGFFPRVDYNVDGSIKAVYLMSTPEDTPNTLVWAITSSGIGISHTGIGGPYTSSWTANDSIIASVITADMVRTGLITDRTGSNSWNLDTGVFRISSESTIGGVTADQLATKEDLEDIELKPGPRGIGVQATTAYYYLSTSSAELSGGTWSTDIPMWVDGKYYWQKFVIVYTDGVSIETDPVCITGAKGANGTNGKDGKDGEDGTRGTGFWTVTTAPSTYTTETGGFTPKYRMSLSTALTQSGATEIFVGDQIRYSYYTYPVGLVQGSYIYMGARTSFRGAAGAAGVGISNVTTQYYLSASDTELLEGEWVTTMPAITEGKYLWSRNVVTYTDATQDVTNEWCVSKGVLESVAPAMDSAFEESRRYASDLVTTSQGTLITAMEEYTAKSDFEQYQRTFNTQLQAVGDKIEMRVKETDISDIKTAQGELRESIKTIENFMKFDGAGLTLGQEGSSVKQVLDNDSQEIIIGGTVVQKVDAMNGAEYTSVKIKDRLQLGNLIIYIYSDGSIAGRKA